VNAARWTALLFGVAVMLAAGAAAGALHVVAPRTGASEIAALVASSPTEGSVSWKIDRDQRVNVLLLAYGGSGGDDPNYTDTMIVLSIRPRPLTATLLSLPRHLRVDIPAPVTGTISAELYAAYSFGKAQDSRFLQARWLTPTGAGDLVAETVRRTIGQPIDGWIAVDEGAFAAVIDALGGVRVRVPVALDDWQYPVDDTTRTMHVHFEAGVQTMDGTRALEYARSRRSTSESDRAARQELVLVAMLQALRHFSLGLDAVGAIGPLTAGLRTDLVPADVRDLSGIASHIDPASVKRVRLEDSDLLQLESQGAIDTLVPVAGNYDQLRQYVASQLP
jgi:LCP family protein required for cell wall assembly